MSRLSTALPALLLALGLSLSGCGSDDESSDPGTTQAEAANDDDSAAPALTEATETETEATETEATETEDTETETEATETETEATETEDTETGGGASAEAFCAANDELEGLTDELDNSTLEGLRSGANQLVDEAEAAAELAPEDVVDDVNTFVAALDQLRDIAEEADTLEEAQAEARTAIDDSEFDEAGDRIGAWVDANCSDS